MAKTRKVRVLNPTFNPKEAACCPPCAQGRPCLADNPAAEQEEWARIFDSLKPGQTVELAMRSPMGMSRLTDGNFHPHKVGRRSTSKKYGVTSIALLPMDGSKPSRFARFTLRKRGDRVSAAHGDMAVSLEGLRRASPNPVADVSPGDILMLRGDLEVAEVWAIGPRGTTFELLDDVIFSAGEDFSVKEVGTDGSLRLIAHKQDSGKTLAFTLSPMGPYFWPEVLDDEIFDEMFVLVDVPVPKHVQRRIAPGSRRTNTAARRLARGEHR